MEISKSPSNISWTSLKNTFFQGSGSKIEPAKSILSIHSIKLPGVKKSVIWHECDENSVKTPLGCKKPFTSSCHQDVNGFLHPGGVFLYYIDFTSFFVVTNF